MSENVNIEEMVDMLVDMVVSKLEVVGVELDTDETDSIRDVLEDVIRGKNYE